MATAAQVIKAIMQQILVQASEAPIEADEANDVIFAMNNYMLDLDANGITLGYTVVDNTGDTITIPTGALRGLIANVAIEIAPQFDAPITPALSAAATAGLKTMEKLGVTMGATEYPSTLPRGSGNEGYNGGGWQSHYYPDLEAQILAETTGAIGLETSTNEVADG